MRKLLILALAVGSLAVVPFGAQASDGVIDGEECAATTGASANLVGEGGNTNDDRGFACVAANGTAVAYIGGEARPEEKANQGTGGACGAVIVGGKTVTGEPNWNVEDDPNTPDKDETKHCD